MSKVIVAYWSQTGNTEAMADAIAKGIEEAGKQPEVLEVSKVSFEDLKEATGFAMGCPSMGVEELEESEMEPFVHEVEKFVSGKNIALFGSYGWGDGEWMRNWEERMTSAGANLVDGKGLICQEAPDDTVLDELKKLGKKLASI